MLQPTSPAHLVLLDDHPLFRQGLRYVLQSLPYVASVAEAGDYPQVRALCQQQVPDALLLDLQLPGTDGAEVAQLLLAEFPQLKIIVLSMHSADKFIQQLMKLGARSYLPKDADETQLTTALEAVLTTGYYTTPRMARALERGSTAHSPAATTEVRFTRRELDVLRLICEGLTTADIADRLFLSPRTVEGHRQHLLDKTSAANATGLVLYAMRHGLLAV